MHSFLHVWVDMPGARYSVGLCTSLHMHMICGQEVEISKIFHITKMNDRKWRGEGGKQGLL